MYKSSEYIYYPYISREYMDNNYSVKWLRESFLKEINKNNGNSELYMLIHKDIPVGI